MGTNKALLKIDGETLIERVVKTVESQIGNPVIITNNPHQYTFLNLRSFPDLVREAGPLGGIYTALHYSPTPYCLVLACDLPFLTGALIKMLIEGRSTPDVLVVDAGKGPEPLCAVYRRTCLPVIRDQLDSGNLRVTDLYAKVNTRILNIQKADRRFNPEVLFNVNSPEDLDRARRINREGG